MKHRLFSLPLLVAIIVASCKDKAPISSSEDFATSQSQAPIQKPKEKIREFTAAEAKDYLIQQGYDITELNKEIKFVFPPQISPSPVDIKAFNSLENVIELHFATQGGLPTTLLEHFKKNTSVKKIMLRSAMPSSSMPILKKFPYIKTLECLEKNLISFEDLPQLKLLKSFYSSNATQEFSTLAVEKLTQSKNLELVIIQSSVPEEGIQKLKELPELRMLRVNNTTIPLRSAELSPAEQVQTTLVFTEPQYPEEAELLLLRQIEWFFGNDTQVLATFRMERNNENWLELNRRIKLSKTPRFATKNDLLVGIEGIKNTSNEDVLIVLSHQHPVNRSLGATKIRVHWLRPNQSIKNVSGYGLGELFWNHPNDIIPQKSFPAPSFLES